MQIEIRKATKIEVEELLEDLDAHPFRGGDTITVYFPDYHKVVYEFCTTWVKVKEE